MMQFLNKATFTSFHTRAIHSLVDPAVQSLIPSSSFGFICLNVVRILQLLSFYLLHLLRGVSIVPFVGVCRAQK